MRGHTKVTENINGLSALHWYPPIATVVYPNQLDITKGFGYVIARDSDYEAGPRRFCLRIRYWLRDISLAIWALRSGPSLPSS